MSSMSHWEQVTEQPAPFQSKGAEEEAGGVGGGLILKDITLAPPFIYVFRLDATF